MGTFGLHTVTNTKVAVGNTTTVVLAADATLKREWVQLVNDSDETIYFSLGAAAVMGEGERLNAGGGAAQLAGKTKWQGAINAICASGAKNLTLAYGK